MFVGRARSAKIPTLSGEFAAHTLALADALPYLLWTANADGLAEFFNVAWREYTGLSVQESAGLGWFAALHVDDVEEAVFAWERATATGEPYEVRHRVGSRDGTYRMMSGRAIALRDADGKVIKWVGTYADVHDAVEAAARLERANLRYRALLEQIPANVWTANAEGDVEFVSPGWTALSGWSQEAALKKGWLTLIHPNDRDKLQQLWRTSIQTGLPYEAAFRYLNRRTGYYAWASNKAVAVRDADGNVVQWIGVSIDIQRRSLDASAFRYLTAVGAATSRPRAEFWGEIARSAVSTFADASVINLVSASGGTSEAAAAGDPGLIADLRAIADELRANDLVPRAIRSGRPLLAESPSSAVRSAMCVAVGEPPNIGVILLARGASRAPFEPEDAGVMTEVAERARDTVFA